jgi:hypothetical protein
MELDLTFSFSELQGFREVYLDCVELIYFILLYAFMNGWIRSIKIGLLQFCWNFCLYFMKFI